jgi:hypothetical protein
MMEPARDRWSGFASPERLERRSTPTASPFTVAVLPDTQFYS